jgi:hypothetical protein
MEPRLIYYIFEKDWKSCHLFSKDVPLGQEIFDRDDINQCSSFFEIKKGDSTIYIEFSNLLAIETFDMTRNELLNKMKTKLNPFI